MTETDVRELRQEVKEMKETLVRVDTKLTAHLERTREEISALFAGRRDHDAHLCMVERTYVPKPDCERDMAESMSRINDAHRAIAAVQVKLATIFGGAVVVASVLSTIVNILIRSYWK